MEDYINMSAAEITGKSFDCSCGRHHSVEINSIHLGSGVINKITDVVQVFKNGTFLIVSDNNTSKVIGEGLQKMFDENNIRYKNFVYTTQGHLIPNEKAIGRALIEIETDTSLIIAAGSGVINDVCRYISAKTGIPYIVAATAPSMDGYTSVISPLIVDNKKITFNAVYAYSIIGDTDILKEAPINMLRAGFGDVVGKITALADWNLSTILNNEHFCPVCAGIVMNALGKCIDNADGISFRSEAAIMSIMEALVLSGAAIGLYGNSRPASGAEHYFAHYWDTDAIKKGLEHPLHGNSVAAATVVVARIYEIMKPHLPKTLDIPDKNGIIRLLERAGACTGPHELGIKKDLFMESIFNAMKGSNKYTVLNYVSDNGMLEQIAEKLMRDFYPGI